MTSRPAERATRIGHRRWWQRPVGLSPGSRGGTVHGVLGVLAHGGRYLLIRRAAHVRVGGVWCFPGGTIERRESDAAALVREMREELGLTVAPIERLHIMRKHAGRLVLHWWSARITNGRPAPNPAEVCAMQWMTAAQIRALPTINVALPLASATYAIVGNSVLLDRLAIRSSGGFSNVVASDTLGRSNSADASPPMGCRVDSPTLL